MELIYIHGIGEQEPPKKLKQQYDEALLGRDAGEQTRLAYWADILHPSRAARGLLRGGMDKMDDTDSIVAIATMPIEELVPDSDEARLFAHKLFERMTQARPRDDEDETAEVAVDEPGVAKALPTEPLRSVVTRVVIKLFIHDVAAYFYEADRRADIDSRLEKELTAADRPLVLVSHSLGTVISYEVLHRLGHRIEVPLWITLGSPLGMREVQKHVVRPLQVPPGVKRWANFADRRDPVALDPRLANDFTPGEKISDHQIKNSYRWRLGWRGAHAALGYLSDPSVQAAVQ